MKHLSLLRKEYIFSLITPTSMTLWFISCTSLQAQITKEPVDYVNPNMGSFRHLLAPTFPTIHGESSAFDLSPYSERIVYLRPFVSYSYKKRIPPCTYTVYLNEEVISMDYALSHQSAIFELSKLCLAAKGANMEEAILVEKICGEFIQPFNYRYSEVCGQLIIMSKTTKTLGYIPFK